MSSATPKQNRLSLKQKYDIIKEFDSNGGDRQAIIHRYGLKYDSTLSVMLKSRHKIVSNYESMDPMAAQSTRYLRLPKYHKVDEGLVQWMKDNGIQDIRPKLIQEKAKQIAHTLGYHEFKASDNYVKKFIKRQQSVLIKDMDRSDKVMINDILPMDKTKTKATNISNIEIKTTDDYRRRLNQRQHSVSTIKTRKPVGSNSVTISINDIFDELMVENKRLLNELLFANNCLNELKTHLINIHSKYETTIDCEDKQEFNKLTQSLDQISGKSVDINSSFGNELVKNEVMDKDFNGCYTLPAKNNKSLLQSKKTFKIQSTKKWTKYDNRFECNYKDCESVFAFRYRLTKHMKCHTNANQEVVDRRRQRLQCYDPITDTYRCDKCDDNNRKSFKTYKQFYNHWKCLHSDRPYHCQHTGCDKRFKYERSFIDHQMVHTGDRPLKCPEVNCTYSTARQSCLHSHRLTHTDVRPVRCEYPDCSKTFKDKQRLRQHVIQHHNEGPVYHCEYPGCDRQYKIEFHLKTHRAIHLTEPTLPCNKCDQLFQSQSKLRVHKIKSHNLTPIKKKLDHPCEWPGCPYKGTLRRLRDHKVIHTGERPYGCEWTNCDKRFRFKSGLVDHMNMHNNVKPYACHWPGCQYRCVNNGNLRKHLSLTHKQ